MQSLALAPSSSSFPPPLLYSPLFLSICLSTYLCLCLSLPLSLPLSLSLFLSLSLPLPYQIFLFYKKKCLYLLFFPPTLCSPFPPSHDLARILRSPCLLEAFVLQLFSSTKFPRVCFPTLPSAAEMEARSWGTCS